MRVGLLIYGDINTISGGYLYDRKLVEYLRQKGDEVTIISIKKTSYFKALLSNTVPAGLNNLELDVLIQDELIHPSFWRINNKLKKIIKCPIVSLVHLFSFSLPAASYMKLIYRVVEKRYLLTIDALILNSRETFNQARNILKNELPLNLLALPCGNNFSEAEEVKKQHSADALKILFVGNISQQKGLHVLIKAMYEIDNKKITLSVIGREDIEPRYVKKIKKYIELNGLADQIEFFGSLASEALKEKYLEHDIFVLPSVNEAYGIVYLEAMQFSLPVIGCNFGGAKELIDDQANGFLIDPEDSIRLTEIINSLNSDRQLLRQMSETARQKYLQHPTWDETLNKIRLFLLGIIKEKEATVD